jgi:hypothetical protein
MSSKNGRFSKFSKRLSQGSEAKAEAVPQNFEAVRLRLEAEAVHQPQPYCLKVFEAR